MQRLSFLAAASLVPAVLAAQATSQSVQHATEIVPAPATTLPLKHAPQPTTPAITAADLMTRLYIFADDSMQGREAGTIGNVKGTEYIASEVKRFGLQPAGENGSYFQTLPFKTRSVDPASSFTAGGAPLTFGTDWAATGTASISQPSAQIIYGGRIGDSLAITPDQVKGKLLVLMLPQGQVRPAAGLQQLVMSASGLVLIAPDMYMNFFKRPATFVDDTTVPRRQGPTQIFISRAGASKLFDQPLDQLKQGAAGKPASLDVRIKTEPVAFPARNVVAILPGSDPKLKGEYVAIGAHNDHIGLSDHPVDHDSIRIFDHIVRPGGAEDMGNQATPEQQAEVNKELAAWRAAHPNSMRPDSISNGADDDGSGSVSVLEIAEKMASLKGADRPKRSILFVWHVGEEKGLLGSEYFTDHPTVPRDSIVAQLNIDMVGRGDAWDETGKSKDGASLHGNNNYLQLVGSRRLSTELGDLAEKVNTEGKHGLVFDYSMDANGHPMNIYCRSDHYEYARYGIPIIFFTTGGHSDYHQVTDEPEYIDYAHMARVDNFIGDLLVHVANLDHRPAVDHQKPDPHGACQQ